MTAALPYEAGVRGDPAGSRTLCWIAGLTVAVAAHAGAVALAVRAPHPALPAAEPAPVVMLELAPEPAAPPSPQTSIAASIDQPDPQAALDTPPPLDEPPPPAEPPPDVETPLSDALPAIEPLPDLPPAEVAEQRPLRRPDSLRVEKRPETAEAPRPERKRTPPPEVASRVAAPERAETAQAPQTVATRGASVSPARWQSQLIAHLERRKRYPSAARRRGQEGTAQIRFTIDGSGNVLSAELVRSSGHAALDEAVLELMRRASPVPAPPPDAPRTITAPVRFTIR